MKARTILEAHYHQSIEPFSLNLSDYAPDDKLNQAVIMCITSKGLLKGTNLKKITAPPSTRLQEKKSIPHRVLKFLTEHGKLDEKKSDPTYTVLDRNSRYRLLIYRMDEHYYIRVEMFELRHDVFIISTSEGIDYLMKHFRGFESSSEIQR